MNYEEWSEFQNENHPDTTCHAICGFDYLLERLGIVNSSLSKWFGKSEKLTLEICKDICCGTEVEYDQTMEL